MRNFTEQNQIRIIDGKPTPLLPYLYQIWQYKQLIFTLVKRDLKIKYAQTLLGLLWVIIQPLTGLVIFTLFFDRLIQVDTNGIPYPLFAFVGLISWYFFAYTVASGGIVLTESNELIRKIYFPKLILPIVKMLLGFVDFLIGFILLLLLIPIFGIGLNWPIFLLPLLILFNGLCGLSISIWLSAITVQHRDFYHIIPYLVNFGIWLTPVFYPGTLIPNAYHFFLYINPMAAVIAAYRWALLGDAMPSVYYLVSVIPVLLLFITGILYFRKIEDDIADFI